MKAQISPIESCDGCQLLVFRQAGVEFVGVERLTELAGTLSIPTHTCYDDIVDTALLGELVLKLGIPETIKRRKLLLCGSYLEEQISITAQYMLVAGYDVHLVRDLVLPRNAAHSQFHDLRLVQFGAVMTTVKHLIYEWASSERDQATRELLHKLLYDGRRF